MEKVGQIYELIGKLLRLVFPGYYRDYAYRIYNPKNSLSALIALNPVLTKYGLFICPEILEQSREERTTQSGGMLKYTILTVRYTVFAPDGSSITMTVVGEGMDSGDKSSNKAMSVAMKYAMFQLFCIPTEEMIDSDSESYDVQGKGQKPQNPGPTGTPTPTRSNVSMTQSATVPAATAPGNAAEDEVTKARKEWLRKFREDFGDDEKWSKLMKCRQDLVDAKVISDIGIKQMNLAQLNDFFEKAYSIKNQEARKAS